MVTCYYYVNDEVFETVWADCAEQYVRDCASVEQSLKEQGKNYKKVEVYNY